MKQKTSISLEIEHLKYMKDNFINVSAFINALINKHIHTEDTPIGININDELGTPNHD